MTINSFLCETRDIKVYWSTRAFYANHLCNWSCTTLLVSFIEFPKVHVKKYNKSKRNGKWTRAKRVNLWRHFISVWISINYSVYGKLRINGVNCLYVSLVRCHKKKWIWKYELCVSVFNFIRTLSYLQSFSSVVGGWLMNHNNASFQFHLFGCHPQYPSTLDIELRKTIRLHFPKPSSASMQPVSK